MASLATSQFIFHDDTIDILVGNRVVNNVQLTNSCILALHRIGRFDVPQVFAVYISSEEPGLHSILFRLSTIKDVATLVPLMRIDISSIMSNCPGLTVSHLFQSILRFFCTFEKSTFASSFLRLVSFTQTCDFRTVWILAVCTALCFLRLPHAC